jgi:uncharacterized protein
MLSDLSPELTDHLLRSQFFGRIGCAADGQILVVPVSYLFDGQAIYGQTREGTKTRLLRQNPAVCFEVDEICSPLHWRSVVVQGIYEELEGDERYSIEQQLGPGRAAPLKAVVAKETTAPSIAPTVVYRIRILSKSGRSETKDDSEKMYGS